MADSPQYAFAHLNTAPFVQSSALALAEEGRLASFLVQLVEEPGARWQQTAIRAARLAGFDLAREFGKRRLDPALLARLRSRPIWELLRVATGRIDRDRRPLDMVFHIGRDDFDRWVARTALDDVDGVYGFEYGCMRTFQEASRRGLRCVYDVPSPEMDFAHAIIDGATEQFPELDTPYDKYCRARQPQRAARRRAEFEMADVVIAASRFTRDSFVAAGWDASRIRVAPYGAPPPHPDGPGVGSIDGPVEFLWAGTFGVRKGAHVLVEAWRRLGLDPAAARVRVHGAPALPQRMLADLPPGIELRAPVPRSELEAIYRKNDMLIFPTLCDAFGMVLTEAFAMGLPVLATRNAGASDLLAPGVNGLLCEPGDADDLAENIAWAVENRGDLRRMRAKAWEAAGMWQWSDHRRAVREAVDGVHPALPECFTGSTARVSK